MSNAEQTASQQGNFKRICTNCIWIVNETSSAEPPDPKFESIVENPQKPPFSKMPMYAPIKNKPVLKDLLY